MEYKRLIYTVCLVAVTGLVSIYPFDGYFRFTLSVAVLSTLLLYFPDTSVIGISFFSGVLTFLLRVILGYWLADHDLSLIVAQNFPALLYYVSFGLLFHTFRIRNYLKSAPTLIFLLVITDVASNIFELMARDISARNETVFASIVGVALCRSVLSVYGYYALKKYYTAIVEQDRMQRYVEMTMLIAKLKSELFYLKKSSQNIEQTMEKGHALYQGLRAFVTEYKELNSFAEAALDIAREIHEVKKDYYRVSAGIENVLQPPSNTRGIKFSEIFFIMKENTERYLKKQAQDIAISFTYRQDFTTERQYVLVAILDNLIMNAIEACGKQGYIQVSQSVADGRLLLSVADSGCGIDTDERDIIFVPGYSTKYCHQTGKMSTGLGLSQVKSLTEALDGSVTVTSQKGTGAIFTVTLPVSNL